MRKRHIVPILIAAAAVFAATPAQSGASGTGLKNCGGSVRAGNVTCPKAKRIAVEYAKTRAKSLQGFSCKAKRNGGQLNARCALDRKLVLFSFRA